MLIDNLYDDFKKFLGLPPYDDPSNIVRNDGYFWHSLLKKYGLSELELNNKYDKFKRDYNVPR